MPAIESGKVCIFGAGGPVGASAARFLEKDYTLRLTDIRMVDEIKEPQSKHAPMPIQPEPPHEWRRVDITNYEQVLAAAQGMDALINVTVVRPVLAGAFSVNLIGAYNVMKAAAACGIRRVIHTGPRHIYLGFEGDYRNEFDIPDDIPLQPGSNLYALTKHLGGQVVRVFAEEHGIEVICFLYCGFAASHGGDRVDGSGIGPFHTSWEDTGEAFWYGLRAPDMPRPYEVFDIVADLPHRKWGTDKAERLLGWKPRYNFERLYRRKTGV
ncbi:MAG: NAD(P)-dependent oxidoreductase [bacterium]|nr:NAD(P)-dependent oxidoreductase [bacterium]